MAGAGAKHVVRADAAMGQAALVKLDEHTCDGTQHHAEQLGLRPRAQHGRERRAGGREADHEAGLFAARGGGGAIGKRGQQAVDGGAGEALQGVGSRGQVPTHLHGHQPGLAIPAIDDLEGGQAAAGAGQRARDVDPVLAADQGVGLRDGDRGLGWEKRHDGGESGEMVDKW
jgi:hypothetical protein